MSRMIPLAEAKKQFSAIIKDVEEKFDRFTITKSGFGKAVILSNEEYDGLLETLDILSCKEERRPRAGKGTGEKGKTVSLDNVKKKTICYDSYGYDYRIVYELAAHTTSILTVKHHKHVY